MKKRVLAVDDDRDILEAIELVFAAAGYDINTASGSDEMYRKVTSYKPDVIVLDLLLSGSDGSVICSTLKHTNSFKHIPVIIMSAHPSAKALAEACGAEGFVTKPFAIDDLLGEVKKLIS